MGELPDRTMVSLNANGKEISPPNSGGSWGNYTRSSWGDSCLYDFKSQGLDVTYNQKHNNIPAYYPCYLYKRTA